MYAQLCKRLAEQAPNFESAESKITTFKRLLLRQCRDEFENRTALSATYEKRIGELSGDEEEARYIAKRKMLGNIKFIGELGKLEMLHDSILHRCCEQLVVGRRKQPINDQIEDLECLAHLIKTCGRVLDTPKARLLVDQYFERLRAIVANNDTPTRIKFLLQDVIELRDNRWIPRRLITPDGPRTIQQVREDAARDGCIYLPQNDHHGSGLLKGDTESTTSSHLQEVIFSKSRPKGMEDLFGGPGLHQLGGPTGLGVGPGVIDGEPEGFLNGYGGGGKSSYHMHHRNGSGSSSGGGPSTPTSHHLSFEEKFNNSNNNRNGGSYGRRNGGGNGIDDGDRYHHGSNNSRNGGDYGKPYNKRDNYDSAKSYNNMPERPDFGDRFTANRNKTHPSNRGGMGGHRGGGGFNRGGGFDHQGGGGRNDGMTNSRSGGMHNIGDRSGENGSSMTNGGGHGNGGSLFDRSVMGGGGHSNYHQGGGVGGDKDLPPRFKKLGMSGDLGGHHHHHSSNGGGGHHHHHHAPSLRPASNSMMLKPKTPSSLPKSAIAKVEGGSGFSSPSGTPKMMMPGAADPPVFIRQQQGPGDRKRQEKNKNQGPTRDEVFGKIEEIVKNLVVGGSTNEAFTAWKEADIPNKMVNNALIHLFKQVVKMAEVDKRELALKLVDQLNEEDAVTQVQCKEGLGRLIQLYNSNLETVDDALAGLAQWAVETDKTKLAEVAEMTEGGATHPLFFCILEGLKRARGEEKLSALFKEADLKLLDQMPTSERSEERLGDELEQRKLTFLMPLLHVKGEIWRKLSETADSAKPDEFLAWLTETAVPEPEHQSDPAFVSALVDNILRYITEKAADSGDSVHEREKELVAGFKLVLDAFLKKSAALQLIAIYRMQVFFNEKGFPKGLLLRWFVAMYEADIIEEAVFLKWKEDVNDTYPGKGKALFQVNQWLTWLEEAESEDEEDEE